MKDKQNNPLANTNPAEYFYEFLVVLPLLGPFVICGLKTIGIHFNITMP